MKVYPVVAEKMLTGFSTPAWLFFYQAKQISNKTAETNKIGQITIFKSLLNKYIFLIVRIAGE